MTSAANVLLLDVDPDLGRFLSADEREQAQQLVVPVTTVPRGRLELDALLEQHAAFGALILEGVLLREMQVGEHVALRLLGPGDIISRAGAPRSMLLGDPDCRVAADMRLALLGNEVLIASHRCPRLVAGLHVRTAEQCERLAAQLAICQLSRVDQRLLALMWLLAESWGQVTPGGTLLPMSLTHDALGALIGARRPTVTLALGELSGRGAIVRQDRGWLLLQAPPGPGGTPVKLDDPRLIEYDRNGWSEGAAPERRLSAESYAELRETVGRLREEHIRARERVREQLAEVSRQREQSSAVRRRIRQQTLNRRRPLAP